MSVEIVSAAIGAAAVVLAQGVLVLSGVLTQRRQMELAKAQMEIAANDSLRDKRQDALAFMREQILALKEKDVTTKEAYIAVRKYRIFLDDETDKVLEDAIGATLHTRDLSEAERTFAVNRALDTLRDLHGSI